MQFIGKNTCCWLIAGATVLALVPNIRGQGESLRDRSLALHADVTMILVPVTVMNRKGAPVNGLAPQDFTVLDNRIPQKIVSFISEDTPCSVGLVLDVSGSMRNEIRPAKEALTAFLGTANPQDEFLMLGVSTRPQIYPVGTVQDVQEFTQDTTTVQNSIQLAPLGGSTALVDTIATALQKMRSARNPRRALIVVSDGMDNHSRHSKQELLRLAEEADVQIYTIAIENIPREKKAIEQVDQRRGLEYLQELANRTGGVYLSIRSREETVSAAQRIGSAIRNQYVIGYQPQSPDAPGKWHKVQVKLDRDQVNVHARTGYHAQ